MAHPGDQQRPCHSHSHTHTHTQQHAAPTAPVRISGNKRLRNVCAAVVLGCCGASPGEYTTARLVFTGRKMRCPQRRGQVVWVWVWVRARALTLLAGEAPHCFQAKIALYPCFYCLDSY